MAATAAGAALTESHRLAQARLGRSVVRQMAGLWSLIDPADLDGTVERWLRLAVPVVERNHGQSARLAAAYLRTFRTIEAPDLPPFRLPPPPAFVPAQTTTSLTVTGPVVVRASTAAGAAIQSASDAGLAQSAAAAMRLTLNGGRDTIVGAVNADPDAQGWARATSGNPCAFCAMLASRGPAYSEETVGFEAHDGCGCTAEPVYSADADWPSGSRQYQDLWRQAKAEPGDTTANFRRLIEGR